MQNSGLRAPDFLSLIDGSEGYALGRMPESDLNVLYGLIREQYLARVLCLSPQFSSQCYQHHISDYHLLSHRMEHQILWPKRARILGPKAVLEFKQCRFFESISKQLGDILISGEDGSGWEEIYWRIVRPGNSDIGDLHADKWFWDLGHGDLPEGMRRIKIWIAIATVSGKSGLRVIPSSHLKKDWKYHGEVDQTGKQKPKFDEELTSLNIVDIATSAGDFILFHDELIHAGMPNMSDQTRVSLEATLLIKDQD